MMRHSDTQLTENSQEFFLEVAGFVIKLVFEPTEQVYFKRRLLDEIDRVWGNGGFLQTNLKKVDFEIWFKSTNQIEMIQKSRGVKQFYLIFRRNFSSLCVFTYYYASLGGLQMLLKEIFAFLLKKDGFLLHASGCLDKAGNLKLFLAPTGGGKTTVSDLLSKGKGLVKFSDDILIVRKQKGKWKFFSPPFIEKDLLPVKREAKNAELFFVKKSKKAAKKEIRESKIALRLLFKQIWSKTGDVDKRILKNAMVFVKENSLYWLHSVLDGKELRRVLDES